MSKTFPHDPAFPFEAPKKIYGGLTIREHFAGLALQGILANPERVGSFSEAAEAAVLFADALIDELNRKVSR